MDPFLTHFDQTALHQINQVGIHPFLDWLMPAVSSFDLFKIPLLLGGIALMIFGKFRERLLLILVALLVLTGDAGLCNLLKKEFHRPRPHEVIAGIRIVTRDEIHLSEPSTESRGRSFPSAHTWNNIAVAVLLFKLYGRKAAPGFAWALLVGYSRIYTGSHYPSDVLASLILGALFAWGTLEFLHTLWKRWGSLLLPDLWQDHPTWWYSKFSSSHAHFR